MRISLAVPKTCSVRTASFRSPSLTSVLLHVAVKRQKQLFILCDTGALDLGTVCILPASSESRLGLGHVDLDAVSALSGRVLFDRLSSLGRHEPLASLLSLFVHCVVALLAAQSRFTLPRLLGHRRSLFLVLLNVTQPERSEMKRHGKQILNAYVSESVLLIEIKLQ